MSEPLTSDATVPDTDPVDAPQWPRPLTLRLAVKQSWLIHPDWTPSVHLDWLRGEGYDTSRWANPEEAIVRLLHGLHADAGAGAAAPGQADELTPERWHEAARRAYRRDRDLLEEAFAGITRTPDLGHLFAGVVHYLDRPSLLTLAGIPALLAATTTASVERPAGASPVTTPDPAVDLDLTAQAVAAVQTHYDAFHEHLPVAEPVPGLQRSTTVADAGQRVLDVASIITGRPMFVVAPSDHAFALSVNPPEDWIGHRSTFAVLLQRGELLLGFTDGGSIHAFPQPEPVDVIVGGRVVTVRTTTGRLLIMDSWVEVYRQQKRAHDRSPQQALQTPPPGTAHAA